jgi:hypothetical protein
MITPISSWSKSVYIAKRTSVTKDTYGNQTQVYATPIAYTLNVQPVSEQTRIDLFGANAKKMYKALAKTVALDINELDVVYLDGATSTGETVNGANSNFVVRRVSKQNMITMYYFESIKG